MKYPPSVVAHINYQEPDMSRKLILGVFSWTAQFKLRLFTLKLDDYYRFPFPNETLMKRPTGKTDNFWKCFGPKVDWNSVRCDHLPKFRKFWGLTICRTSVNTFTLRSAARYKSDEHVPRPRPPDGQRQLHVQMSLREQHQLLFVQCVSAVLIILRYD